VPVHVRDPDCVRKTFPGYFAELERLRVVQSAPAGPSPPAPLPAGERGEARVVQSASAGLSPPAPLPTGERGEQTSGS
jgi:hypothetical protein